MSVWGKFGGAGIGWVLGGPLGALVGAMAGHFFIDENSFSKADFPTEAPPHDVVFATGLVALCAKMAKADGVVLRSEVEAFESIIDISQLDRSKVEFLFRLAQTTTNGFEGYASQLASALRHEPALLEDILDGLFYIAKADHAIHEAELRFLKAVSQEFGFSESDFARISARHIILADDPYVILGLERRMGDKELKQAYRRMVAEYHPDREIARGLPPEAIKIATERLATINAAWDRIAAERQLK